MKGIGFKNMKALKEEQWFDFEAITLLTGTNNSGKSSIINAMQMLQDNLSAKNIDELFKIKFTIKNRQDKHGSIASFVSNKNPENKDTFICYFSKAKIKYSLKIKITEGLETYGMVKSIVAKCEETDQLVFLVNKISDEPEFKFQINVNYKYFIDRWYKKYENTLKLREKIPELEKLAMDINNGKIKQSDGDSFLKKVEKEFSVYVDSTISIPRYNSKEERKWGYDIQYSHNDIAGYNYLDEIGVIVEDKKIIPNKLTIEASLISEEELNKLYKPIYEKGFIDFSFIWELNAENENEFQTLIKNYYQKPYKEAYRLFSDDVITVLSHCLWENFPYDGDTDPMIWQANYLRYFLAATIDFGLKSLFSNFQFGENKFVISNNDFVDFKYEFASSDTFDELYENNFFDELLMPLQELYSQSIKETSFRAIRKLIYKDYHMPNLVHDDINRLFYKLDFSFNFNYVSSNRFSTKRTYNFNEKTDFSSYLKQIEYSKKEDKNKAIGFVNKWLKEFEIADKLILTGDNETGTFKAYLQTGKTKNLLIDFGLGTNQLLPVFFALASVNRDLNGELNNNTVVIEEPEANLHPALQSKLADMLVDAKNNFSKRIIVETHSEYLIRKIQYLCAKHFQNPSDKETIKPEDVKIYYFNADKYVNANEPKVKELKIDNFGGLSDSFGNGFFDEATTLKFQLLKLNQSQQN